MPLSLGWPIEPEAIDSSAAKLGGDRPAMLMGHAGDATNRRLEPSGECQPVAWPRHLAPLARGGALRRHASGGGAATLRYRLRALGRIVAATSTKHALHRTRETLAAHYVVLDRNED
jgi:hypothetical protein